MCILLRRLCKVHPVPAIIGESFLGRWQCEQNYRGVDTSCGGCRWGLVSGWEGEWVMEFPVLPPEINSVLMYSGAGSSPLLARRGVGWAGWRSWGRSGGVGLGRLDVGLTGRGCGAGWRRAGRRLETAYVIDFLAYVYEETRHKVVPPATIANNREEVHRLIASNVAGVNTPAIADLDAQYDQYRAQNIAVMNDYQSTARFILAYLPRWQEPPQIYGGGGG